MPSSDDDQDCTRPGCGITVTDDAVPLVETPCPARACTHPSNKGPCVVSVVDARAVCGYCDTPFTVHGDA